MMELLDAGIQQSEKRDAEKGVVEYRESDVVEDSGYRVPLRVAQEMSGEPVGFECPKPMTPP
ncbi:MAG TPA: hypothetical protein VFE36_14295 [Candidatus Baltobacteraceae bacterium]|nr:hypothetical protein [Candidatus Baltobacteraceae bacterium]